MDKNVFSVIYVIKLIGRWRRLVLTTTLVALVGGIVVTDPHILKPYYKSVSSFYPLNPKVTSTTSLYDQKDEYLYGGKDEIDRCISIGNSNKLRTYIVHKYHLFHHYDIDSANTNTPNTKVMKELDENITVTKNEQDVVEVTVYDVNKDTAAAIANDIVAQIDQINQNINNTNREMILGIFSSKMKEKLRYIDGITDTILKLRNNSGIVTDIKQLGKLRSLSPDEEKNYEAVTERIKVLEENKRSAVREYNNTQVLYEQTESTINKGVPTVYVLDRAVPAEKKSKPVRWLITTLSVLIIFILTLMAVIFIDQYKYIKEKFLQ